jgi:hypothetical protein
MTTDQEPEPDFDPVHSAKWKYFIELLPTTNDVTVIVLKGHLVIEEILNEIIKSQQFPDGPKMQQ